MALIRRSDWPSTVGGPLLSDFFDDDRFLNSPWLRGETMPAVNIKENEKNYEIELAVPGFQKSDFNVSLENGLLTVSAEKKEEAEKNENNYKRKEFNYRSFTRSFNLPDNISEDDVDAKYTDGVLKLMILKKKLEPSKPKKAIQIK